MEFTEIFVPESKKNEKWCENLISYYNQFSYGSSQDRNVDQMCWSYFNNEFNLERFDYFLKIGNFDLPTPPRHIPLQRHLLDTLISQQTKRPFVYSVSCSDKKSIFNKQDEIIKGVMRDLSLLARKEISGKNATMQQIQDKMSQIQQMLQTEPQDENQAQQQMQLRQMMPQIQSQFDVISGTISEDMSDLSDQFEKIKKYWTYDFKDIKEDFAQKRMLHLYKSLKIKNQSKKAFINRVVTGKGMYYVDMVPGNSKPIFVAIDSRKVTFPNIDGIDNIQDGPWVKVSDEFSYQQVIEMYGDKIERKYGRDALEELSKGYHANQTSEFVSTPRGEIAMGDLSNSPYSGTRQHSQGILVDKVFIKIPRKIYVKSSPNKYKPGSFHTHFISSGKPVIDTAEYNYDARNRKYSRIQEMDEDGNPTGPIDKPIKKDDVEEYNSRKGESMNTMWTNDIYAGVVIDRKYYIDLGKKKALRHPDRHGDVKLPVFGETYSGVTEKPYSLIWTTKDLQDLYDVVHTQRELMLALAGTKTLLFDKSQRPGDLDDDEFLYQMKKGIAHIETIEPGGQPKRTTFNQWSMVDMSVSASVQYLDGILMSLERIMGTIIGVPPQRVGQVVSTDQVGTYMESLNRAMLVTEILYFNHDAVESEALTHLLNLDLAYCSKAGDIFEVIDVDFGREIVQMIPGLFDDTYISIMVGDHSEMMKRMQELREIAMVGFKSGNLMFEQIVEIMKSETLVELAKKVEYFTKQAMEIREKSAQAEHGRNLELEQMKIKMAQEFEAYWRQMDMKIQQTKMQLDAELKMREIEIKERDQKLRAMLGQIDTQLRQFELMNEKASEDNAVLLNDKHSTIDEQIRTVQMQVDTMLQMMQMSQSNEDSMRKHVEAIGKISVEKEKARKMVREHVSDK